jgi:hypothetical protein
MKTQHTLSQLAEELDRRAQAKQDFIVPTQALDLVRVGDPAADATRWGLAIPDQGVYDITPHTHNQIANRLKIPTRYYQRLLEEAPDLLQDNVRHWFAANTEPRMIRTLDQQARAYLSNKYKRVDNEDVAQAVLPVISANQDAVVLSSAVTDQKMYLKVLFPKMEAEIKPGDTVRMGVSIANGEIGNGSTSLQAFFYRDFCTNGCVFGKHDAFYLRRPHLGGRLIEGVDYQILSDRTQQMQLQTLQAELADMLTAATDPALFEQLTDKLREATEGETIRRAEPAVEVLAKTLGLTDDERGQVLINLIEDRDYSRWGALNAVTKVANEHPSYDRATELEGFGGKLLDLNLREWKRIAYADAA